MPKMDTSTPPPPPADSIAPLSKLAVASVVCSGLLCCPATSLLGIVLGFAGLRRTGAMGPRLRGRRLALTGVVLGAVSLFMQLQGLAWFQAWYTGHVDEAMVESAEAAIIAVQNDDQFAFDAAWSAQPGDQPDDSAITAFGSDTLARYGPLVRVEVTNKTVEGSVLQSEHEFVAAVAFVFESREVLGSIRYRVMPSWSGVLPQVRPFVVEIGDEAAGDLRLGPPPGS